MKYAIVLLVLQMFVAHAAHAQYFKIENRQDPSGNLGPLFDELENEVNAEITKILNTEDLDKYLDGTANAFSQANKGLGVDYGSDMKLVTVGVQLGLGVDSGDQGFGDMISGDVDTDKIAGAGASVALFAGVNLGFLPFDLGPIKLSRTKAFVNLMTFETEDLGEIEGDISISNFGAHIQYKLIEPVSAVSGLIAKWYGVDVTTGFDISSLEINAKDLISQKVDQNGTELQFDGEATVGIDVSTFSIPVEISTGGSLFYFLGAFVGLGFDINAGSAEPTGKVTGNIFSPQQAGVSGDATLELSKEGEPDATSLRMFAGLELNAAVLKIFAKYSNNLAGDAMGVSIGVSGGW